MTEKQNNELAQIEETQKALIESIEATKGLAEKAETLIQKHRKKLQRNKAAD